MNRFEGIPIVLTADRTLMADYRLLLDGMVASTQTTITPYPIMKATLLGRPKSHGIRTTRAPLGLRRIEAALVAGGFSVDDVVVVDPSNLHKAIGPRTKVVGITSGDPLGIGMTSTTMTRILGGTIYPGRLFKKLMKKVRRLIRKRAPGAKVVYGGPGGWQFMNQPDRFRLFGIDHVVTGYAEDNVVSVIDALTKNEPIEDIITGQPPLAAAIPPILHPSTMGIVEASRGCGLGCSFCTISRTPMIHLPTDTIIADVKTNIQQGMTSISLLSEDFFRYGGTGKQVDPPALIGLLEQLREIEGLKLIQVDHATLLNTSKFSDDQLQTIRRLLVGKTGCRYPWLNVGVETPSGRLLKENSGAGKMGGMLIDDWGSFCRQQILRICRAGLFPLVSLVTGLPGETDQDIQQAIDWVQSLSDQHITVFPLLYVEVDGSGKTTHVPMPPLRWKLFRKCYKLNLKWMPRVYWDNQKAVGVGLPKRISIRLMALGQVCLWKTLLGLHSSLAALGRRS